jgi:hypothetical protein
MQFFKYSFVIILLLLTPVESIMAACSDWLAPNFMKADKPFVIHYYVTLKTRSETINHFGNSHNNYEYYPGYKDDKHGDFYFDLPQGKPITLALTGYKKDVKKMFVMPAARGDIKAFFWPYGWTGSFRISDVLGGYFSPEIWKNNPRKGPTLTCVKKTGSRVLLSLEEAKNFRSSSGKKTRKLTDLRPDLADTLSPKETNGSNSTIAEALKDNTKYSASNPDLSKKKYDVIICDTKLRKLSYSFPKEPSPVTVSGLLKGIETQAYWFDPSIDTSPHERKFNLDISSITNRFVVVEIPYKKGQKSEIFPVRFNGIANVQKVFAETAETYNMNILVVGDASSIAISGLEQMEKILLKKSHRKFYWTIDWRNIAANGKWQASQKINSFAELIKKAKSVGGKKVLLTEDDEFINFIDDFEKTVLGAKKQIDFVIWVKHGYQVPLKTPALIGELIQKIHEKGNIPRFSNGNPHKWLYILSGSMPGKSLALLEEPINRARQHPGYVEEEKTGRSPRRLLDRPETLANIIGMRHMKPLPAEFSLDPDKLAVDANHVFSSLGLLLSVKSIDDLLSSMNMLKNMTEYVTVFSGIYDPTVLMNIQSTNAGEPKGLVVTDKQVAAKKIHWRQRNHKNKNKIDKFREKATSVLNTVKSKLGAGSHCTHIYVKDTEMGLNWLDKD